MSYHFSTDELVNVDKYNVLAFKIFTILEKNRLRNAFNKLKINCISKKLVNEVILDAVNNIISKYNI
jgi:hypothetical protein